ncbi:hypothetical protein OOK27_47455 [Streptomyces canus]|uniref:hypothetical protein n=1 Tax=Streptomyces canus TaxID=58343 RepID=UPI0022546301|nr:hypothetical protein [Streptomyces canus]MCX5261692.1 hypothetical protein [Streptomyces canus]
MNGSGTAADLAAPSSLTSLYCTSHHARNTTFPLTSLGTEGHVGLRLWEGAYTQTDNTSFAGATGDLDVAHDAPVFQPTTTAATGPRFTGS